MGCKWSLSVLAVLMYFGTLRAGSRKRPFSLREAANLNGSDVTAD